MQNPCNYYPCYQPNKCIYYRVKFLTSNQPNVASNMDFDLLNAWGILYINGIIWVSCNGNGLVTTYDSNGVKQTTTIAVDSTTAQAEFVTGLAYNSNINNFIIQSGKLSGAATILIGTENGSINAWSNDVDPGNTVIRINNINFSHVYDGLAIADNKLYIANFYLNVIHAYNSSFKLLTGYSFVDATLPSGFAPFNIVSLNGLLYVLYAKQKNTNIGEEQPGPGNGYINIFNISGIFQKRFASAGPLNAPWGLINAPETVDLPCGTLLVSNHGDGKILAYGSDGCFIKCLNDACGNPIIIDGLWGLANGSNDSIYFSAGPNNEVNGLVGSITPTALEPACPPYNPYYLWSTYQSYYSKGTCEPVNECVENKKCTECTDCDQPQGQNFNSFLNPQNAWYSK